MFSSASILTELSSEKGNGPLASTEENHIRTTQSQTSWELDLEFLLWEQVSCRAFQVPQDTGLLFNPQHPILGAQL